MLIDGFVRRSGCDPQFHFTFACFYAFFRRIILCLAGTLEPRFGNHKETRTPLPDESMNLQIYANDILNFLKPVRVFESLCLRHPEPPTGGFGPFGPEVSGECLGECLQKSGCPRECLEVSWGPFGPWAPECPKGVPRVSPECQKGVRTHQRHSRDTFWTLWSPGPEAQDTPSDTPDFRGHSLGHSPGHFGPEGPEASCGGLGMSQVSAPWPGFAQ